MRKIIFICKGNMTRSQIAEAFYNNLKKDDSIAESYGTMVKTENREGVKLKTYSELGLAIEKMKKLGFDISEKVCKQVTPECLVGADKVIVMAEKEFTPDWLENYPHERWDIENPGFTKEEVNAVINKIENNVQSLLA